MKNLILFFFAVGMSLISLQAQNHVYEEKMGEVLESMTAAKDQEGWQNILNQLERIAKVESSAWLPEYYRAYSHLQLGRIALENEDKETTIEHIAAAQNSLKMAEEKAEGPNSEITTLQANIYLAHLWYDPMTNGAKYSPAIHQKIGEAIAINPRNPRAYLIRAQLLLFTPSFYGGGPESAAADIDKSSRMYEQEQEKDMGIQPSWGKEALEWLKEQSEKMAAESN